MKKYLWGILILMAGLYFVVYFSLFPSHPFSTKGEIRVKGLHHSVNILRDRWGIPEIKASSLHDLFFAQGFIHCQERFFQMDISRRAAQGRLSELFGEKALPLDEEARKMGIYRFTWEGSPIEREILQAYADGVNACLEATSPSFEYKLLRAERERWRPQDSLYVARLLQWSLAGNFTEELIRAKILSKRPQLRDIWPILDPISYGKSPYIVPEGKEWLREIPMGEFSQSIPKGMSNNWVISPQRTEDNKPILANDPHLGVYLPGIWYFMKLNAKDYQVWGASLPGTPGIVIGRNRRIAWGFTNSFADVQDLYMVKIQGKRVLLNGQWEDLKEVREVFHVRGKGEVIKEYKWTSYGPLIYRNGEYGLVLRWVGWKFGHLIKALYLLNTAQNWEGFRRALSYWSVPSQNVVYADVDGNIGYQLCGLIPKKAWSGLFPVEKGDWEGYYSMNELPHVFNPPEGIIVTANQRIKPDFAGAVDTCMGYRAARIRQLLSSKDKITLDWVRRVQTDVKSLYACRFLKAAVPLVKEKLRGEPILDSLSKWDCEIKPHSRLALIYELWVIQAQKLAFFPGDKELQRLYIGGKLGKEFSLFSLKSREALVNLLEKQRDDVLKRLSGGKYLSWSELLRDSFVAAKKLSRGKVWGDIHYLDLTHPMGRVFLLRLLFPGKLSLGKIPFEGDLETVVQAAFEPLNPGKITVIPSMRMIINFSSDRWIYYEGQSGIPSEHYSDLLPLYLAHRYIKFRTPPFQRLVLKP